MPADIALCDEDLSTSLASGINSSSPVPSKSLAVHTKTKALIKIDGTRGETANILLWQINQRAEMFSLSRSVLH